MLFHIEHHWCWPHTRQLLCTSYSVDALWWNCVAVIGLSFLSSAFWQTTWQMLCQTYVSWIYACTEIDVFPDETPASSLIDTSVRIASIVSGGMSRMGSHFWFRLAVPPIFARSHWLKNPSMSFLKTSFGSLCLRRENKVASQSIGTATLATGTLLGHLPHSILRHNVTQKESNISDTNKEIISIVQQASETN